MMKKPLPTCLPLLYRTILFSSRMVACLTIVLLFVILFQAPQFSKLPPEEVPARPPPPVAWLLSKLSYASIIAFPFDEVGNYPTICWIYSMMLLAFPPPPDTLAAEPYQSFRSYALAVLLCCSMYGYSHIFLRIFSLFLQSSSHESMSQCDCLL